MLNPCGTAISLAAARTIVVRARAHARSSQFPPMTVAVLDAAGRLVAFAGEDGSSLLRERIARGKAHSVSTRGKSEDAKWNACDAGDAAGGVRCRWVGDGVPMTATSPSSVAESASSTIDPDAQARRAHDGQLSAGIRSDLTIDEDAVDGLFTAEEVAAEFDKNLRR